MAEQQYHGYIKSFVLGKGWGFIECEETHQIYGKDIFVMKTALPGGNATKGDSVTFYVKEGNSGPEATDVKFAAPGGPETHVGNVKSFNPVKGYGMISCQQTFAVYGKDMFFMKSSIPGGHAEPGQKVSFLVVDGLKGPEASNLQLMNSVRAWAPPPMAQAHGKGWGKAQSKSPRMPAIGASDIHRGVIKSFGERGWGMIECEATWRLFGKDMFVLRTAFGRQKFNVGDWVQFKVTQGVKGPEATECVVLSENGYSTAGQAHGRQYHGQVKSYNADKGWGFIACDETMAAYGKDIFLYTRVLAGHVPTPGEAVTFSVAISDQGRPEASDVSFGNKGYTSSRPNRNKGHYSPY